MINGNTNNFSDSFTQQRNRLNAQQNQNVYVQPPTRNENSFNNNNENKSLLTNGNDNHLNIQNQNDQQNNGHLSINEFNSIEENNLDSQQPMPNFLKKDSEQDDNFIFDGPLVPSHLKPQRSNNNFTTNLNEENSNSSYVPTSGYNSLETNKYETTTAISNPSSCRKNLFGKSEPRLVSFQKEGNCGIRIIGGNQVGIFVTAIQPGSPAEAWLKPGDKLLKINNVKIKGVTKEEAVLYLLSVHNQIDLLVQYSKNEYDEILLNQKGDSFYIRANFNHQPASSNSNELAIEQGDIFHVTDTLYNNVVGHWYVSKLNENREEIVRGIILNESKANAIFESKNNQNGSVNASSSFTMKNNDQNKSSTSFNSSSFVSSMKASFFRKKRSARRTKSLGKEHWEELMFADRTYQKLTAYQKIEYKHPGFVRKFIKIN